MNSHSLATLGLLAAASLAGALSITACHAQEAGRAWREPGAPDRLIVTAGPWRVVFNGASAWTIREASYGGAAVLTPSGAYQTVARRANVPAGDDPFIGTGHGGEEVLMLMLEAGGREIDLLNGAELPAVAERFVLRKRSRIGPYRHEAVVSVSAEGIRQEMSLAPGDGIGNVNLVYPLMHCLPKSMTRWRAGLRSGEMREGEFTDDRSFTLNAPTRWLASYDPKAGRALLFVHPGDPPGFDKLWNRQRDNKLYRHVAGQALTQPISATAIVTVFEAPEERWADEAKQIAEGLLKKEVADD